MHIVYKKDTTPGVGIISYPLYVHLCKELHAETELAPSCIFSAPCRV